MSAVDTGGPAFPFAFTDEARVSDGMTLRDYFAANAPITISDAIQLFKNDGVFEFTFGDVAKKLAGMRVSYADAMLKELK